MTDQPTKHRRVSQYVTATVDVEVDIAEFLTDSEDDQLADLGLHRDDSCPVGSQDREDLLDALTALHQQAHADQPIFLDACLREPCRSISLRRHPQLSRSK